MRETFDSSKEKGIILPENLQNFRKLMDICWESLELSRLIALRDEEKIRGENSLTGKLGTLGNDYQHIFDVYSKTDPSKEEINEWLENIQKFLIKLSKIIDEMVIPANKWKNDIVDWFVKKMFEINDSFNELNRDIKKQKYAAFSQNRWLYEDDYTTKFSVAEMYNTVVKDYDAIKEDNKKLWIFVYRSLLKLTNKELKMLLGEVWEKKEILSEKDFEEVLVNLKSSFNDTLEEKTVLSKWDFGNLSRELKRLLAEKADEKFKKISEKLFVMDYLNIVSYEDFCKKYNYLKDMQKQLIVLEDKIDECFDEWGNLEPNADIRNVYMENLRDLLDPNFFQRKIYEIGKVLSNKKRE